MTIRKARPDDAATIADFNSRLAWETERRRLNRTTVRRGVRALLRDATKGTYYVAEAGGKIVGQLSITHEWSDWRNGRFWWIQSVYVAPEFRRTGVFRSLYAHVKHLAETNRAACGLRLYVEKDNHRAQQTYERLGMAKTHYEILEAGLTGKPKPASRPPRRKPRA